MTITTPAQMREAAALAVANIEIGYHDGIGGDWHPYNGLHIISAACAAIHALPVAEPEPLAAVDLWPDKEDVSEAMNAKGYFWQTCSGCHETHEGVPTGPVHPVLGCAVGHGCYECGGIGAVWDTTDYADLSDFLADKDRALPVAAPLCTWPSCGHTAKGQCNPTFAPPVAEQQAIRDQALNDAAQAASNRAAYFRDAAETASEAGFHALRAFHAMRELCLVEIAAAIRAMKGKPE